MVVITQIRTTPGVVILLDQFRTKFSQYVPVERRSEPEFCVQQDGEGTDQNF